MSWCHFNRDPCVWVFGKLTPLIGLFATIGKQLMLVQVDHDDKDLIVILSQLFHQMNLNRV